MYRVLYSNEVHYRIVERVCLILTVCKVFLQTVCLQVRQCIKERFILLEPLLPCTSVDCSPDRSVHMHTVTLHTSDRSAWHSMYSDKNVYPYRIHIAQQFTVSVCSGWFLGSMFTDLIAPDLPLWGYVKVKCVVIGQWPQKSPSVRRNQGHFNRSTLGSVDRGSQPVCSPDVNSMVVIYRTYSAKCK
jgi:hypothetical protein